MSLTNEQITAQNFKDFYDRIRPLLNSQHYHVDRGGQELKTLYAKLDSDWTISPNQKIPFIKKSGTITQSSNGSFTIPSGTRIELLVSISHKASSGTSQPDILYSIYNDTDDSYISTLNSIDPFQTNEYSHSNVIAIQWTNDLGHDIDISVRPTNGSNAFVRALFSSLTIKEIGRIVDPIQYTANNDELEETPVGNIISYMGNSVPKHYLACDGTLYNIGTYPELEAHFIDEFGSVNYFGGDGTTTWAVPNLNGEFLRGTGTNSHTNQGSGANVGKHQDGTEIPFFGFNQNPGDFWVQTAAGQNYGTSLAVIKEDHKNVGSVKTGRYFRQTDTFTNSGGDTTFTAKPTNTSVKFCIKYESTYHVIVPSHMYKVSIAGSISTGSGDVQYTFNQSDIIGDASLVSGNSFVAPVDGFYIVGMDVTNKGSTSTYTFIKVNGVDREFVTSSGSTHSLYLNKGDVITIWQHGNTASHINSGRLSFCLLTANYKDNIIAGGEVYSEEEQLVGTWKDGKPLYQKTIGCGTLPNNTTKAVAHSISNLGNIAEIKGEAYFTSGSTRYNFSLPCANPDIRLSIDPTNLNIVSTGLPTGITLGNVYVTVQYTKTTDQANTYQYKNSLLLTRPDMWEPNTEYDFGGGLYGQRFTGTLSTAGASAKQLLASVSKIVDQGGQIKFPSWVTAPCPFGWGSNFYGMAFIDTSNKLMFNIKAQTTETATYDIWVTYKK